MPRGRLRERSSAETAAAVGSGAKRVSGVDASAFREWISESGPATSDKHARLPAAASSTSAKNDDGNDILLHDRAEQLLDAVRKNDVAAARDLLRRGVSPAAATAPGADWSLLHLACAEGRGSVEMVSLLLSHNADANAQTGLGLCPLHFCAVEGHIEAATALLDAGAEVNMLDHDGMTPLLRACAARRDDAALARLLLSRGTMVEYRDEEGWNVLHLCARYSLWRVAEVLVKEFGADVDATMPSNRWTPLMLCCSDGAGSERLLALLLDAGAAPDARSDIGVTALHVAAYNDWPAPAAKLLAAGADAGAVDAQGRTPLHKAALAGSAAVAAALLEAGADPATEDSERRTPLHCAAAASSAAVAHLLLDAAERREVAAREEAESARAKRRARRSAKRAADALASVHRNNDNGEDDDDDDDDKNAEERSEASSSGEPSGEQKEAQSVLALPPPPPPSQSIAVAPQTSVREGARSRKSSTSDSWTTDEDATGAAPGEPSRAPQLTRRRPHAGRALVNAADAQGRTPLIDCCDAAAPSAELVELLLARGARAAAADRSDATALCHAAANGAADVVRLLLARGADVNHPDEACRTPLLLALGNARGLRAGPAATLDVLRALCAHGADADMQDAQGACALAVCAREDLPEAAALLLTEAQRTPRPDLRDEAGRTPFLVACARGHTEMARLLLRNDAALDAVDRRGDNAVALACRSGSEDVLPLLLKEAECPLPLGAASAAALADVCARSSPRSALLLLDAGASVDAGADLSAAAADTQENSEAIPWGAPLLAALRFGHTVVVERLLKLDKAQRRFRNGTAGVRPGCAPLVGGVCPKGHPLRPLQQQRARSSERVRCALCRGAATTCCDRCKSAMAFCAACRSCAAPAESGGGVDVRKFAAAVDAPLELQALLQRALRNANVSASGGSSSSAVSALSRASSSSASPTNTAVPLQLREALRPPQRQRSMLSRLTCRVGGLKKT